MDGFHGLDAGRLELGVLGFLAERLLLEEFLALGEREGEVVVVVFFVALAETGGFVAKIC